MPRTENKLTACMVVQELNPEYFEWNENELRGITNRDTALISHILQTRLERAGYPVQEIHTIIHDRDTQNRWNEIENKYETVQKAIHFHSVIKFRKVDGNLPNTTINNISRTIGIEPQYIEKPHRGVNSYDNMLAYLIHIKDPQKFQYRPEDVYSSGYTDSGIAYYKAYRDIYRERREEWLNGRAKKRTTQAKMDIDALEEAILLGEVSKNQILLTDAYFEVYARNKRRCDDAFDTYAQRKIARTIQRMEEGEFKLTVYFITGRSHSGKSQFTDRLINSIREKAKEEFGEDWGVCSVAASNPYDEYMGEEIMVMDDLRGIALSASDWLKLLDPDRINTGSARYRNKKIACRCIVINSEKDVMEFFYYLKGNGTTGKDEAMDQFFRRILARVQVYKVPDTDERRLRIGEMQECSPYTKPLDHWTTLTLHHDFKGNLSDYDYDSALLYLTDMAISRNKLNSLPEASGSEVDEQSEDTRGAD